ESNTRAPGQQSTVPVEVLRATLTSRLTNSTKVEPASTVTDTSMIRSHSRPMPEAIREVHPTFSHHGATAPLNR
ncbi:hypothetical protein, partial [Arthrobacter sp. SO3]|uniref:hypothetical protein n=1 Tax=Arthrobacter sp. SO3 TaxID=1897057 RepID=UPI001CFFD354